MLPVGITGVPIPPGGTKEDMGLTTKSVNYLSIVLEVNKEQVQKICWSHQTFA